MLQCMYEHWRGGVGGKEYLSRCDGSLMLAAEGALGLWLGQADRTEHWEGAASAQGMHRFNQVPTCRESYMALPATCVAPPTLQQKLAQLDYACLGKFMSQHMRKSAGVSRKDGPRGTRLA